MKNFMVMLATTIMLMAIVVQMGLDNRNFIIKTRVTVLVDKYKEIARQEGCFDSTTIADFKREIEEKTGIKDGLLIEVTENPVKRINEFNERGMVKYKFGIPIKGLFNIKFFNIPDEKNKLMLYYVGEIGSELI